MRGVVSAESDPLRSVVGDVHPGVCPSSPVRRIIRSGPSCPARTRTRTEFHRFSSDGFSSDKGCPTLNPYKIVNL